MSELILLLIASGLGALAFFEPCSIATHTLFAARAHQKEMAARWLDLFTIWWVRSVLLAVLFSSSTMLVGELSIDSLTASIVLSVMALVYLVSREVYIPVPHLEFYRLFPGSSKFTGAVKLGLTAPACTLPLLVVLIVLLATVNSVSLALVAALLFASLFSLPMVVAANTGMNASGRDFFSKAASGTPYLTALLLFSAAAYLVFPDIDPGQSALEQSLQQAGVAALGVSFIAGFVFSFNPVSFASIPVVLAYVTRAHEKRQALSLAAVFIVGLVLTHIVLGVAAASGGDWVKHVMGREWGLLLGPLLILLGMIWAGWLKLRLPWIALRGRRVTGHWGAFLLSIPFSVAICPFCAPALLVMLTTSASIGSVVFGAALLLSFALGRSIPILLGAWSMGWLESLQVVGKHHHVVEMFGGVVLILSGFYMLNEYRYLM